MSLRLRAYYATINSSTSHQRHRVRVKVTVWLLIDSSLLTLSCFNIIHSVKVKTETQDKFFGFESTFEFHKTATARRSNRQDPPPCVEGRSRTHHTSVQVRRHTVRKHENGNARPGVRHLHLLLPLHRDELPWHGISQ